MSIIIQASQNVLVVSFFKIFSANWGVGRGGAQILLDPCWQQAHITSATNTDGKVHVANIGPIWGRQDPGGPHVGPMNFAIWVKALMVTYLLLPLHQLTEFVIL